MTQDLPPLTLKRALSHPKAKVQTRCTAGTVTILTDQEGSSIAEYSEILLAGKQLSVQLFLGETTYTPTAEVVVRSDEALPVITVRQYLANLGMTQAETEETLRKYDLEQYSYYYCPQAPATVVRQLQLLRVLRTTSAVLVLEDPFQPFNGRWREDFAEQFLQLAKSTGRIILVLKMSFIPQNWTNKPGVEIIDVGLAAQKALATALQMEAIEKAKEQKAKKEEEKNISAEVASVEKTTDKQIDIIQDGKKVSIVVQDPLSYAYREVRDFIFDPLAQVATFLRSWTALIALTCFVFLIVAMGVFLAPNLLSNQRKLQQLAAQFKSGDISWTKFKEAFTASPSPSPVAVAADEIEPSPLPEESSSSEGSKPEVNDPVGVEEKVIAENLEDSLAREDSAAVEEVEEAEKEASEPEKLIELEISESLICEDPLEWWLFESREEEERQSIAILK